MSGNRIDVPYGDVYVLEPNVWKGKFIGAYARQVMAFQLNDDGEVTAYITAVKTVPHGVAIWMPDGTVEEPGREWPDLETYEAHLKATLLQ